MKDIDHISLSILESYSSAVTNVFGGARSCKVRIARCKGVKAQQPQPYLPYEAMEF